MYGCDTYCEHGGICVLSEGHTDAHDSGYCLWSDAEAISKAEADDRLRLEVARQGVPGYVAELLAALT